MRIIEAHIIKRFKIHLLFDNEVCGVVDFSDLAGHGVFKAWMEPGVFEKIVVTESGSLEWPGSLDLCPDSLYLRLTKKEPEEIFPLLKEALL
ncbi:MAG: hypothetical protein A3F67_08195 [Verrucomicrobia bacterium RIFCSPHIGHO2_12_FULL_41_10]|nr:MAG: hypothetical protein A3F67_08195 [Verrucomicrobia bacterium RIFCSPHIGHO2_12_FULL_41_10]HLB33028.1 DUF2442 domain-containing protein [Chthoniobacterales bacterium]